MTQESDISTRAQNPGMDAREFTNQTKSKNEKEPLFKGTPDGLDSEVREKMAMNGFGRLYVKAVNLPIITRYLVYMLPVALLLAAPIIIYVVIKPSSCFAGTGVRGYLFWAWIETSWLSIWVAKLVAKIIPSILVFLCGVVSTGTQKYTMVLKAVELQLSLMIWAVVSLVAFTALTNKGLNDGNQFHWVTVVKNLLVPALFASILYLMEKLFIQLLSINYHGRSFDIRIKDSKHSIHLLELLFIASSALFPMHCHEFAEEDCDMSNNVEAMRTNAGVKISPLRLVEKVGRIGDRVTSVFGHIASDITGNQGLDPNSAYSVVIEALKQTRSSEALARRLWMSFVMEGRAALYPKDLQEILGPTCKEKADEAFTALDDDRNGDISLDEMIMQVVEIGREMRSIATGMRDVGQAIGVLDQVLVAVLFVIVTFMFVAFQNTNFVTILATAGTVLISLSFVFAVTTQELLGSCIFLFVKHPYDVGDRVDIVGPFGNGPLVVEQISLLYTVFKRIDSMKVVQLPNIVLNTLWVENITRSKALKEQLDIFISFDTPLDDIELLRKEMEDFVRHPDNCRHFQSSITLDATGIGNMDMLQLQVMFSHKSSCHNETVRTSRRSKFMCALVLALRKIPIYAPGDVVDPLGGPSNPSYSVTMSDTWATEARAGAARLREESHLIHLEPALSMPGQSAAGNFSEGKATEHLERHETQQANGPDRYLSKKPIGMRTPRGAVPAVTHVWGAGVRQVRPRSRGSLAPVDEEAEVGI